MNEEGHEQRSSSVPGAAPAGDSRTGSGQLPAVEDVLSLKAQAHLDAERLRVVVKSMPVMLSHQDRQLRYTWVHWPDAPLATERIIGKTDAEIFEPEEARRLTEIKLHVLHAAEGMRAEVRTTIAGAAHLNELTIEPLLGTEGDIAGITCVSRDVTGAKRAERIHELVGQVRAALTEASDFEQTLTNIMRPVVAELADCCMLELLVDGQFRRVRAVHRDRGKTAFVEALESVRLENGRGLGWEALNRRQSTLHTKVGDTYLRSVGQDERHLRLLRELAPVTLIAVPLVIRKRLLGAMVLAASGPGRAFTKEDRRAAEEITAWAALAAENARLERVAVRAHKDRDETIGIVAHDLRSPLSVIENCARAIAARLRQSAERLTAHGQAIPGQGGQLVDELRQGSSAGVRQILRSSGHANRLISDLLDASRKNGGRFPIERRRVRVEKLIAEAIETHRLSASPHPLALEIDSAAAELKVWCDRRRIGQVLQNLLDNAVKFSPADAPIVVHVSTGDGELLVRVSDQGCGIAPEHLEHVFERFWRGAKVQRQGTGLGLSICKEIVEAHGGRIWADSRPGAGSDFYFTLPAVTEASRPPVSGGVA